MIIKSIDLSNFRNIRRASLEFSGTFNFVYGKNAQGKTNLLEAIHLFSLGRSFRTRRSEEMVMFSEEYFFLRIRGVSDSGVSFTIDMGFEKCGGFRVTQDGRKLSGLSEIIGVIPSVIFTPQDVELASGPPAGRRLYIDYTAAQISPAFLSDLKEYRKVLRQRNTLLRSMMIEGRKGHDAGAWDEMLIEKGAAVVRGRREVLERIDKAAWEIFHRIRPGGERLGLSYVCSFDQGEGGTEGELKESLGRCAEKERRKGYTLTGPHYDDMRIKLGDNELRRYGSQGQRRLAAIVLKMAQAVVIMERRAERPVVLLDDIFSELDDETAGKVRELLSDRYQSFITSPRDGDFPQDQKDALMMRVEEGVFTAFRKARKGS